MKENFVARIEGQGLGKEKLGLMLANNNLIRGIDSFFNIMVYFYEVSPPQIHLDPKLGSVIFEVYIRGQDLKMDLEAKIKEITPYKVNKQSVLTTAYVLRIKDFSLLSRHLTDKAYDYFDVSNEKYWISNLKVFALGRIGYLFQNDVVIFEGQDKHNVYRFDVPFDAGFEELKGTLISDYGLTIQKEALMVDHYYIDAAG